MRYLIILFSLSCIACSNNINKDSEFKLLAGDILFQDLDSSPLCDAIELVTPGYKDANLSHIGIITELANPLPLCTDPHYDYQHDIKVLEAIPNKVKQTRLDSFLNRSFDKNKNPKVIVGRLKPKYQYCLDSAIIFLNNKLNIEYDDEFLMHNNKYYCSELIYEAFENDSIFKLRPMTFLHPETKDTLEEWKKYYSEIGVEIPENKLGINPGIMSLSERIEIVHIYGIPDGMAQ